MSLWCVLGIDEALNTHTVFCAQTSLSFIGRTVINFCLFIYSVVFRYVEMLKLKKNDSLLVTFKPKDLLLHHLENEKPIKSHT